jgi:hypothetical protein
MTTFTGQFDVTSWNEDTYREFDGGRKLTRASVAQTFAGDLTGEGNVEWLMSYNDDATAQFVGLQYVETNLDGRDGSVVIETSGDFDGKRAKGQWRVIPGSANGVLAGMSGTGTFEAPLGGKPSYRLDASFA